MLSVFRKLLTVVGIGVLFLLGMVTTVYLSLRSPVVNVPNIVGKDRNVAETELQAAGLNFRVRAARPSRQVKADTVMFQLPPAGQSVKAGQTVAVDIARVPKEGEASETVVSADNSNSSTSDNSNTNSNENKPKRKPNANANANANANGNANGNRNANTPRPNANVRPNANAANENSEAPRAPNANRSPQTDNTNTTNTNRTNRNVNRTPTPARPAKPAPTPPNR
ncbi:MAG TPA: PASTA domain-containing protein [Pyrinomonadaceae bacterium]|nr:PASTA domain-containing protein [Pyrinomonadaceae bacterium]